MPDQRDGIPWDLLASNLKCQRPQKSSKQKHVNLSFAFKPDQAVDVHRFAESFANALEEATRSERKKYRVKYEPPRPGAMILNDDSVHRISPVVDRWRQDYCPRLGSSVFREELCRHDDPSNGEKYVHSDSEIENDSQDEEENDAKPLLFNCECPVPCEERRTSAFLRPWIDNDCYRFYQQNGRALYNVELIKTLMLFGDMDPVLSVCSHPNVNYLQWESVRECVCGGETDWGWGRFYELAMTAYLGLNILSCFPELQSGTEDEEEGEDEDYRATKIYQQMIMSCTTRSNSKVSVYPHREFFGVRESPVTNHTYRINRARDSDPHIKGPLSDHFSRRHEDLRAFCTTCEQEAEYIPHISEVVFISRVLYDKRLPAELIALILDFAGYDDPPRQLLVPGDPFHKDNQPELEDYLDLCWSIMVQCNMFAREQGSEMVCVPRVVACLDWLLPKPPGQQLYRVDFGCFDGMEYPGKWIWALLDAQGEPASVFWSRNRRSWFYGFMPDRSIS